MSITKFLALFRADGFHSLMRFPIVIAVLFACFLAFLASLPQGLFENGIAKVSVAIVYNGDEEMANMFIDIIAELEPVRELVDTDSYEAGRMLDSGKVDLVIELPSNVIDTMIKGDSSVIGVKANNVLVANIAYSITLQAVETINLIQGRALQYREISRPFFPDNEEFVKNELLFNARLMGAALFRGDVIEVERSVPYYTVQFVSVLLYLTVSILSILAALTASRQFASGVFRRLVLHRIPVWQIYLIKLITTLALAVPLSLICILATSFFYAEVPVLRMVVSSLALCALICPLCMVFTTLTGKANTAYARTLLGSLAVLLVLFFLGGGFYPVYMMDFSFRSLNPAWASHLLAEWVFSEGSQKILTSLQYILPPAVCAAITVRVWRSNLR